MRGPRFRDRSTGDILVLLVAGTVCFTVVTSGATIVIIEIFHPSTDTEAGLRTITGIINTLIGLLAGFLAGKTGSALSEEEERKKDPPP